MAKEDLSAELRTAFLESSARELPDSVWDEKDESHDWLGDGGLVHQETSPSLGALTVSFDAEEITLFFGERGYHLHFTAYADDWPDDEWPAEGVRQVAADAVDLTKRLLRDELVFRSGILATGVRPNRRSLLRRLTPWVRESLWSGRSPMQ